MYQTSLAHQRTRTLAAEEVMFVREQRALRRPDAAIAKMLGRRLVDVQAVGEALWEAAPAPTPTIEAWRPPTMPPLALKAAKTIARDYEIPLEELFGRNGADRFTHPRQHVYADLIDLGFSGPRIGSWFGRNHTTIFDGALRHRSRLSA